MEKITRVGFIGLGNMGFPMAARLGAAGFELTVFDANRKVLKTFGACQKSHTADSISELASGVQAVITMLPDGKIVRQVALGSSENDRDCLAEAMPAETILIDMSSSSPTGTRQLGEALKEKGILMLDAPVSGGVSRANAGTLAIMAGGDPTVVRRCTPLFAAMGEKVFETGKLGSGHAMKVLNNLVSAAGLIAAAEALCIGARFGLQPETMVDILNASTGRNNSTENKFKQFILSRKFNSGFSLDLMVKDLTTAMDLARDTGVPTMFGAGCRELWAAAQTALGEGVDHTDVVRWFEEVTAVDLNPAGS